jgi:hypothetical protein
MSKPFLPFHLSTKNSAFWAMLIVCLDARHSAMISGLLKWQLTALGK